MGPALASGHLMPLRLSRIKKRLNHRRHITVMRVAMAAVVALLILNFVDEHFNDARYTRAATAMLSSVVRSFG
jgi:hypothetical protein